MHSRVSSKKFYIQNRDYIVFTLLTVLGLVVALNVIHQPKPQLSCIQKAQELSVLADIANHTGRLPGDPAYHEAHYRVNPDIVDRCFQ